MITVELTYKGPGFAGAQQKEFSSVGGFRAWLKSEAFAPFPEPQKGETPEAATPEVSFDDTERLNGQSIPDQGWVDNLGFPDLDDYQTLVALGMPRDWSEQRARSMFTVMHRRESWARHDGLADAVIVLWLAKYQGLTPTGKVSQSKSKQILFSFRDQILTWLDDDRPRVCDAPELPAERTRYESPLSRKQWRCARRWYGYDTAAKRARTLLEKAEITEQAEQAPVEFQSSELVNLSAPQAPEQLERIARQQARQRSDTDTDPVSVMAF